MRWLMAALLNGCALIDAAGDTATNQPGDGPSGDTAGPTWVPHRTGIASIGNCQTAAHGTDLFAMSGNTQSTVSEEYSSAADSWSMIMPIPTAVANATATTVGDKIYVLGGILANSNCTDAVQIYDTITNSWTSHQAGGYCRHGAAAIGTTIWVTGGASGSICPFNATAEMFSNCVTKPVPAPTTRQFASVVAIDPHVYLIGGQDNGGVNFDNVDVYDTVGDNWGAETPLPMSRGEAAAVVAGGKIYVIGGRRNNGTIVLDDVDIFDPATHQWTAGPKLPSPMFDLGAAVVGNQIYIVGGANRTMDFDTVYSLAF